MIRLTLQGLLGFDGVYDLDLEAVPLTNRELHWIKEIAGVRLGEFENAADAGDNDLLVAFSVIALNRAGKAPRAEIGGVTEMLWDAVGGKIQAKEVVVGGEDENPPVPGATETPSANISSENQTSSSDSSNGTGEGSPVIVPAPTGDQN